MAALSKFNEKIAATRLLLVKLKITVTGQDIVKMHPNAMFLRKTNNEKRKRMLENGDNEAHLRSSSNSVRRALRATAAQRLLYFLVYEWSIEF